MMRKAICISAALLLLVSCNSFLEEHPRDQKTEGEVVTDAKNLYLATLGNLYSLFGGAEDSQGIQGTYRGLYDFNTFTTDEALIPTRGGDWYDGGFWQRLYLHTWEAGDSYLNATWNYLYKVIVMANRSLQTVAEAGKSGMIGSEEEASLTAEIRAVRAYFYYYLLDMFGRVPIVDRLDANMNSLTQSSRSEVFNFVRNELLESLPSLSPQKSNVRGEYYGRMTRPVALFLLAKLSLNASVWLDDDWTDGKGATAPFSLTVFGETFTDPMDAVITLCKELSSYQYVLEENYQTNFDVYNEGSRENILTIPMDKQTLRTQNQNIFRSRHYDHAAAVGGCGENGSSATLEAIRSYPEGDLRLNINYWTGAATDLSGAQVYLSTGEPLVYQPLSVALDLTGSPDEKIAGARMKKYVPDPNAAKDGKLMDNDIVIFRYADVLLMAAEAKVRKGMDGRAEINAVRTRAGIAPLENVTLDDILAERLREFAWEGLRRQDLIRFGAFTRPYSFRPALPDEENGFTTVFPIPSNALTLNPNLTQNYGYEDE